MLLQIILLIFGLIILIKGADWLVEGASALAKKFGISNLAIGLTIVAFGTSAPELVVNSFAAFNGSFDIVFGNVIGSNNFNLFLILGIAGIITPLTVQSSTVWKEIPISFFAILLLFFLTNDFFTPDLNILSRMDGALLAIMFGLFLLYVYKQLKTENAENNEVQKNYSNFKIWVFIIVGLSILVLGGKIVVTNAVLLATTLGVSDKIIGLTIIAAGTSLPELATSVVAALKKNNDIAVGNIIGSNIFNIFLILSVSSFIRPIEFNTVFNTDLYILAGGTIFLFIAMFTGKKKKLDRWEAALLLAAFIGYMSFLIIYEV
jgi:cation:H+ antiporter